MNNLRIYKESGTFVKSYPRMRV